ncbi:hypothetical protein BD780_000825 [Clostridium tetanomorphum]|uniref:Uncharacterized protein n=1 Tax=Clostridium tetanomorphum TaxID=1553 RepID=A0A923ECY7_CLOTT|nr:hypothetical protein [Clostridium tetanomorphum]KAJ50001.1 hypothetical protein CTM_20281 [Clostridium tetanomorphum DSM 665]MBC2398834.1 hypothetical protein [Clostridium tetanomorphum]MBP1863502.1 hypothetical protein [Clostridium tetanomorphum]NRS83600.1 hypothetical protein [Clostridium tetanomorphum]NRZ96798.1 hypothetical protein [Clostridium tetanomorphum]
MLRYWNEKSILSESIESFLNKFKEFIDREFVNYKENDFILDIHDKTSIIKIIIKYTRYKNIILSKNAWEWIEDENELNVLKNYLYNRL